MTYNTRIRKKIQRRMGKCPGGGCSKYIQLSGKRGIKLLIGTHYSMKELMDNGWWDMAIDEANCIKNVRRVYPYVPKCYGVKVVRIGREYRVGIILQHLGDDRLVDMDEYKNNSKKTNHQTSKLYNELYNVGVKHGDLHEGNVMYYRNRFWAIDLQGVTVNL